MSVTFRGKKDTMLRYGVESSFDFKAPPGVEVIECGVPRGEAIQDLPAAVAQAIASPVEFPPLGRAVVPGDHIAIALEAGVARAAELLAPIFETLQTSGVAPGDISVVCAPDVSEAQSLQLQNHLDSTKFNGVSVVRHDPADRRQASYVAATEQGRALYLNRTIADAEFVISLGSAFAENGNSRSVLYPAFSDQESIDRVCNSAPNANARKQVAAETEQVPWLLGVQFAIKIVPGADGDVVHVVAGEAGAVIDRAQQLCTETWKFSTPGRADLVVAAVQGGDDSQTWNNVARALAAAKNVVSEDGVIALCTDLQAPPGPTLRRIRGNADRADNSRSSSKTRGSDAHVAEELADALSRAKVYLLSQLDDDVVEELGVAPVSKPEEIVRLASQHARCIVLSNAQYAIAAVDGD